MSQELERFTARILFKYETRDGQEGATIAYFYNRESMDQLNIKRQQWDNSQFIEVGDELTLNGHRCKVTSINFKLEERMQLTDPNYGINMYSPTDPSDFNCQIGIFVKRIS